MITLSLAIDLLASPRALAAAGLENPRRPLETLEEHPGSKFGLPKAISILLRIL
ncbi:MAG: hypothetical protein R2788_20065 [Saprospiraceae bacterium]